MFDRNVKLLKSKLRDGKGVICSGLPGASKALLIRRLREEFKKPLIVTVPSDEMGEGLECDLERLGLKAVFLPGWSSSPFEPSSPSSLEQFRRIEALYTILTQDIDVLVLTPISSAQKVLSPDEIAENSLELRSGKEVNYSLLADLLTDFGYRRVDAEPDEGEFTLIGDHLILKLPDGRTVSAELFGNSVELLEVNGKPVDGVCILPTLEMIPSRKRLSPLRERYPEILERHMLLGELSGAEKLLPEVYQLVPVSEYMGDSLNVCIEPFQCRAALDDFFKSVRNDYALLRREGIPSSKPEDFYSDFGCDFDVGITDSSNAAHVNFGLEPVPPIDEENAEKLLKGFSGRRITVVYQSDAVGETCREIVKRLGVRARLEKGKSLGSYRFDGEVLLSEGEAVGWTDSKSVLNLSPGSFVVHRDFGIGRFIGIVNRKLMGKRFDFVEIEYANGERLFAPFTQLDRIYSYTGFRGKNPKLDRLGGTSWRNLERRVRASLINYAREIAQLYRERKSLKAEPLIGDREMVERFEKSFPYRETPDQIKAIRDVYRDMESESPMDRLICGDVGYGKTEVAMRAAMKAVSSGKQVALLAPTTILAEQHYRTFKKRFDGFPVRIEMLSRFVSRGRQSEIIEKLRRGEVDIIIGTHRITGEDIEFKDLGLLIIDEEHRFGVKTKEKITAMKRNIHVLYMSATPIPRTLYSALSGFRNISLIETPPSGRKGTKVAVMKYSDRNLKLAVEKELLRGGQVFIVQNDISELERLREKVEELFPEAEVGTVHGKMRSDSIERVMHEFISGKLNVLIATSIVESGIDIPSANTLIVIGAERFGLSQLYQLRGRVGRGVEKGYCYLFTSPKVRLNREAVKRLEAMKRISPLGGGFQLALKDLEIRGAGTLFGPKQSGYINSVGFDLYVKMLEEVSGEEERDVKVNVPVEAFIPEDYISDTKERLRIYSEIAGGNSDEVLKRIEEVHGVAPDPLVNMFSMMRIKRLAREMGIEEVTLTPSGKLILKFGESPSVSPERIVSFVREKGAVFTPDRKLYLEADTLNGVISQLEELKN